MASVKVYETFCLCWVQLYFYYFHKYPFSLTSLSETSSRFSLYLSPDRLSVFYCQLKSFISIYYCNASCRGKSFQGTRAFVSKLKLFTIMPTWNVLPRPSTQLTGIIGSTWDKRGWIWFDNNYSEVKYIYIYIHTYTHTHTHTCQQ